LTLSVNALPPEKSIDCDTPLIAQCGSVLPPTEHATKTCGVAVSSIMRPLVAVQPPPKPGPAASTSTACAKNSRPMNTGLTAPSDNGTDAEPAPGTPVGPPSTATDVSTTASGST